MGMDVSRRSFLGGALSLFAATAIPAGAFASVPVIYGDGISDDTAGLNALLAGEPFRVENSGVLAISDEGYAVVRDGNFRVTGPLYARRDNVDISYCRFVFSGEGPVLSLEGSYGSVRNCHFISAEWAGRSLARDRFPVTTRVSI